MGDAVTLTFRQKQILQLLVDGNNPGKISAQLQISQRTVEEHLIHLRHKFGVQTMAEMIARAVALGAVNMGYEPTERQREVLQLLSEGCTQQQIALRLNISVKTVKKHLAIIRQRYGSATNAKVIAIAVKHGDVHVYLGEVGLPLE